MKKRTKVLLLLLSAVLLVVASVMGTLAYLTSQKTVTNTFTVGNVQITLDEAKVKGYGTEYATDHENRVDKNDYFLLPGYTYLKDPTVTVKENSEDCYVRMKVQVNGISKLKAAFYTSDYYDNNDPATGVFLLQKLVGGWDENVWVSSGFDSETSTYEFRHVGNGTVDKIGYIPKSSSDNVLDDLFETITIPGEVDNEHLENLKDVTITVTAEAMQAGGFENADKAWEKFHP